ncbi:MAG: P-loop NTPase fold protein, partial [Xenococcus sp. (in: cyanobacteria)]
LLPFRLALLYFGISRQITMFTGISGKSFQISEHAEKLGLQETVGEDLRHLLFGWVGFSKKNKKFINKFIRFWNDINLFFYFCLGIIASVLFHLNVGRTDSVWETDIKPLWMIISQKEFFIKMVSYSSDFPVFGDKLTSLWDLLKKYISVTVPPLINTLKWGAFFLPTFIFALLYWFDRKKSKVLLIVDDLDRLDSYEILDIIESLKLLLEDRRFSDLIQVVIICERISLKRAFRRKYEGIYYTQVDAENETLKYSHDGLSLEQLIEENIQKLFISHIYLPPLGEDERKTVLEHFLKDDDDDENEKIQHGLELNPNSSNRNISNRSKERKKIIPQFDFNSIFKDNAKPKEAPSQVALDEMLYANDVSENSEPSNVDRFNEKKRSSNNSLNYSDRPNNPLDDNDRKALREGFEKLSDWVTLGPRAIQSYIFRYQLARELLLTAREEKYINASKLARNLALKLSGKPLETDLDENMKAVLSEVA